MPFKIIGGIVGALLLLAYMAPVVLRLKEVALWVICLIGVGMMLVDLWESLQSKEDRRPALKRSNSACRFHPSTFCRNIRSGMQA